MATAEEIGKEIELRIKADLINFNNTLPEEYAIFGGGYLAGLFEHGYISQSEYMPLVDILPNISVPDPILDIFIGRED